MRLDRPQQLFVVALVFLTFGAAASAQVYGPPRPGMPPPGVPLPGGHPPPSPDEAPIELERRTLKHDDIDRTYDLFAPPSASRRWLRPLVIVFHGGSNTPEDAAAMTRMHELGRRREFFVAYPAAIRPHRRWNDGRDVVAAGADDVGFVDAMLDDIVSNYAVDARRVFAAGVSNGGMFTLRLACERADAFRAFAAVIANFPVEYIGLCEPGRPVPLIFFHGRDDTFMPYAGGAIGGAAAAVVDRGQVISAEETVAFWADNNECASSPRLTVLADRIASDGTRIEVLTFGRCDRGSTVTQFKVIGGGHTWPGTTVAPVFAEAGRVSEEIDATSEIWQFFDVR